MLAIRFKVRKIHPRVYSQFKKFGFRITFNKLIWRIQKKAKRILFDVTIRHHKLSIISSNKALRLAFVNNLYLQTPSIFVNHEMLKEADGICDGYFKVDSRHKIHCDIENIKWITWEKNRIRFFHRHDFLITLTRAIKTNSDRRDVYRGKLKELLTILPNFYTFKDIRRYDQAIDIAIRILNWTAVCSLVSEQDWIVAHHRYWYLQIEWMKANLSPGGNHKLLEGLALYAAGHFFSEFQKSAQWRQQGNSIVVNEMFQQVAKDGVHKEQSMFYHQICTTHFVKFFLLSQKSHDTLPEAFIEQLVKMLKYIYETQKPDGTHPMIGDGDQLVTEDREHWESRGLIPFYYQFFDKYPGFFPIADSDAADWFIKKNTQVIEKSFLSPLQARKSTVFEQGGHVILRDGNSHYLFFNCGEFGYYPYPHHGHADALSFELYMNGQTVMVDAGGYEYSNDPERLFVRSTAAHNTIMVDDKEQSDTYGIFGVGKTANVKINRVDLRNERDIVVAEHDGYLPIKHIRSIVFIKEAISAMVFSDLIDGQGQHLVKALFHLAPGIRYYPLKQNRFELASMDGFVAHVCFFGPPKSSIEIFDKNDHGGHIRSLVARQKGVTEKTSLLMLRWTGNLPARVVTVFTASKDTKIVFDAMTNKLELSNTYAKCQVCMDDLIPVFSNPKF